MRVAREVRRGQTAVYHVTCRIVAGEFLLGPHEREAFRRRLWPLAEFLQITVHDYTVLSNHFHLVVCVPAEVTLSDQQMLDALDKFYGSKHLKTLQFAQACRQPDSPLLAQLRARYLARMGNLSAYVKELKEGFSKWYNKKYERFGTLWAERFNSSVVRQGELELLLQCAYVDLNSVRAGLGDDPKDYPHCGYAEALAGDGPARRGLAMILEGDTWEQKQAAYRMLLFAEGQWAPKDRAAVLEPAAVLKVLEEKGQVSIGEILRLKVRYLTQAIAFGTEEFVEGVFAEFRQRYYKRRKRGAWPIEEGTDWMGLTTLHKFKDGEAICAPTQIPPDPPEEPAEAGRFPL